MKTYRYCQEVKAFRIKRIIAAVSYTHHGYPETKYVLIPYDDLETAILVDGKYMDEHCPAEGGWYMHHSDGPTYCRHDDFDKHYECCNG